MESVTFIVTHFYEFRWLEVWIRKVLEFTPTEVIREILIIDQDRTDLSRTRLGLLDSRVRVLQYPRSVQHIAIASHDHAAVLNRAVLEARGDYICILDSDAFPIDSEWFNTCNDLLANNDAILAQHPTQPFFSHPCFMLLKSQHVSIPLCFDEGLFTEKKIDTGRRILRQLTEAGQRVTLVPPSRGFSGEWGYVYLDSIYHHHAGSFHGGTKQLKTQLTWSHHYFRQRVLEDGIFELNFHQLLFYRLARHLLQDLYRFKRSLGGC